jgi:hypothetical protein
LYKLSDLSNLRNSISAWLDTLQAGCYGGHFKFCLQGNLTPDSALMPACFGMKIAWQTGLWEQWAEDRRQSCIEYVNSFQTNDGYFYDPWLVRNSRSKPMDFVRVLMGRLSLQQVAHRKIQNILAETRQSASTLLMVGANPKYPMPCELKKTSEVVPFVNSFNWDNPWSAGSHISHQLMMLTINRSLFNNGIDYEAIIDGILRQLFLIRDPKTGTWFTGNPSDTIKINGAMKILSGLQWLNLPYPDTRALLDFALQQPSQDDGCNFLNRLFVVWQAKRGVPAGYRKDEICSLAYDVFSKLDRFKKSDGAFSFFPDHAQNMYFGVKVSRGKRVSDLHGTVMLVWAIAIALELLGDEAREELMFWKAHKS